ncbi:hypothetical protein Pmani_021810 [Petrolisthes manimaculis]|uniref:Uncharacterized protein n=1 Tax=Petrolisthes manimaculis TaxID=1843537 RepID=A0AAE1PFT8_9EUCA|nr:hypothetical protein Pmani_021810 [Petrolisthes manimaculis]
MTIYGSLYRTVYSLWVFLITLDLNIMECDCTNVAEIDRHLEMGVQMLARGQLHDALSHFHAAIDGDPNNFLSTTVERPYIWPGKVTVRATGPGRGDSTQTRLHLGSGTERQCPRQDWQARRSSHRLRECSKKRTTP